MTDAIDKLIADGKWRPIEEAPMDGARVVLYQPEGDNGFFRNAIGYKSWGQFTCIGFFEKPFWYEFQQGDGYEYQENIVKPTHFRPLPDNRLADALKVAVKALELISGDEKQTGHSLIAEAALKEIEKIAEGEE